MRVIARASAVKQNVLTSIPAGQNNGKQLIGPTVLLPPLTATQGLRLIHMMGWYDDPGQTGFIGVVTPNIAVALAQTNPPGALVQQRVRHYQFNPSLGAALGHEGLRFGTHDPNLILGNDYLEVIQSVAGAAIGAFSLSVEADVTNSDGAAAHNLENGLVVLYEVIELADFTK